MLAPTQKRRQLLKDFALVYGVFQREDFVEVALIPGTPEDTAQKIRSAIQSHDDVRTAELTKKRSTPIINVHHHPYGSAAKLSRELAEFLEVMPPKRVKAIIGPVMEGATLLTCMGVIFDEPDPEIHEILELAQQFINSFIGPVTVFYVHDRGFVIGVRLGTDNVEAPVLTDALSFAQLLPTIETTTLTTATSLFVQIFVARLQR
jgi:hypothetical protein